MCAMFQKKMPGWLSQSVGIVLVLLALGIVDLSNGATTHKHDHHGHKERLEDGSFSPRDSHHHGDGGEHNVEFDHEAILGIILQSEMKTAKNLTYSMYTVGSVREAEAFDNLSPEESKKRLAVLVTKMDLNSELQACFIFCD